MGEGRVMRLDVAAETEADEAAVVLETLITTGGQSAVPRDRASRSLSASSGTADHAD